MKKITLPSGQHILSLRKIKEHTSESSDNMESTSGAMRIDENGKCPKCQKAMGLAEAVGKETVFYCDKCRVCLPLPKSA